MYARSFGHRFPAAEGASVRGAGGQRCPGPCAIPRPRTTRRANRRDRRARGGAPLVVARAHAAPRGAVHRLGQAPTGGRARRDHLRRLVAVFPCNRSEELPRSLGRLSEVYISVSPLASEMLRSSTTSGIPGGARRRRWRGSGPASRVESNRIESRATREQVERPQSMLDGCEAHVYANAEPERGMIGPLRERHISLPKTWRSRGSACRASGARRRPPGRGRSQRGVVALQARRRESAR